jgi:hypothetical protein
MRFASGFLVGFFLATLLAFGFVQVQLGPYYGDLKSVQPYVQSAYEITHSGMYAGAVDFVSTLNETASALSAIPFIGSSINATEFSEYPRAVGELMLSAKSMSEKLAPTLGLWISIIEVAPFMVAFSLFMMLVGIALLLMPPGGGKSPEERMHMRGKSGRRPVEGRGRKAPSGKRD